jgi:hypothetical protein
MLNTPYITYKTPKTSTTNAQYIKNIKFNLYLAGYLLRKSNIRSLNILGNNCCYSSSLKDKEPIRIPL